LGFSFSRAPRASSNIGSVTLGDRRNDSIAQDRAFLRCAIRHAIAAGQGKAAGPLRDAVPRCRKSTFDFGWMAAIEDTGRHETRTTG
jgi:hypothetical protein